MKAALTIFVLLAAVFAVYWFMVRPILSRKEKYRALFATLDAVEATYLFKIQMLLKGFKNKLWAWFLIIAPLATTVLQMIGSIDPTIVVPFLPEKYQALVPSLFTLIGIVNLQLRKYTDTKEGELVSDTPTVVEVPTVAGKPDVAIVAEGPAVVAVADTVKAPTVTVGAATKTPTVAEVVTAAETGATVIVNAKAPE